MLMVGYRGVEEGVFLLLGRVYFIAILTEALSGALRASLRAFKLHLMEK